jgi:NitT/TauT family transport system substrate-binding protein
VRTLGAALIALSLVVAACGDDDDSEATEPAQTTAGGTPAPAAIVDGQPFPAERCEANKAAGKITYLTGFDYAAAASMVEVMVAEGKGYFEDLCLDVEVKASGSTANYPLVAGGEAEFASAGSFSEIVSFAAANDTTFVATQVDGRVPVEALIVKPGRAKTLEDLAGTTIGVKLGKLPTGVEAMLATAGLREGDDFQTVPLDGFDPTAHIAIDSIVGFPGYKSNEPGALERAGIDFDLFDPIDYDVAGSFGVVYTTADFVADHPTAAADFVRASLRGLEDALADPRAAAQIAIERINTGGNPYFLSEEGETFRWSTEAKLIEESTPDGEHPGVPSPAGLQTELDQNAELGLFGDMTGAPHAGDYIATDLAASAYTDAGTVAWPSSP